VMPPGKEEAECKAILPVLFFIISLRNRMSDR
jgi:hypothetical protein